MTRTDAELTALFPAAPRSTRGLGDLYAFEYVDRADRARLEGEERARYFRLGAKRHRDAIAAQEAWSLRHYGTTRNVGRLRRNKDRAREGNQAVAFDLETIADRLEATLREADLTATMTPVEVGEYRAAQAEAADAEALELEKPDLSAETDLEAPELRVPPAGARRTDEEDYQPLPVPRAIRDSITTDARRSRAAELADRAYGMIPAELEEAPRRRDVRVEWSEAARRELARGPYSAAALTAAAGAAEYRANETPDELEEGAFRDLQRHLTAAATVTRALEAAGVEF